MKKFKNYVIVTFFLCLFFEFIFLTSYFFTKNYIFENRYETEKRYLEGRGILKQNKKDSKLKVAIFGGSSAQGYGSTISFSEILNNMSIAGEEDIHFDNHATPASPFFMFQVEKIKKVINDYDIFVIYAGHNEWLHFDHNSEFFPNNAKTTNYDLSKKYWIKQIENELQILNDDSYYHTGGNAIFNKITDKIRVLNFIYRSIAKIKNKSFEIYFKNFVKKNIKQKKQIKFFYTEKFFGNSDYKSIWFDNFIKSIKEIQLIIPKSKKVIIVTPITNYFLPPIADYNEKSNEIIENITDKIYENLKNDEKLNLEMIEKIPNGAHKNYLTGHYCLQTFENKNSCVKNFIRSKNLDEMTITVIKPIQDFIKYNIDENYPNFKSIDITDYDYLISEDKDKYLDFFLDVMHPSKFGHSYIANLLAEEIFKKSIKVQLFEDNKNPRCPMIKYYIDGVETMKTKTTSRACDRSVSKIIKWHKEYQDYIPKNTKFISDYQIKYQNNF